MRESQDTNLFLPELKLREFQKTRLKILITLQEGQIINFNNSFHPQRTPKGRKKWSLFIILTKLTEQTELITRPRLEYLIFAESKRFLSKGLLIKFMGNSFEMTKGTRKQSLDIVKLR